MVVQLGGVSQKQLDRDTAEVERLQLELHNMAEAHERELSGLRKVAFLAASCAQF